MGSLLSMVVEWLMGRYKSRRRAPRDMTVISTAPEEPATRSLVEIQ